MRHRGRRPRTVFLHVDLVALIGRDLLILAHCSITSLSRCNELCSLSASASSSGLLFQPCSDLVDKVVRLVLGLPACLVDLALSLQRLVIGQVTGSLLDATLGFIG
jgi:hypothetical protein